MTAVVEHDVMGPGATADVVLAEKAVLGAAMRSRSVAEAMIELLPSEDCFASPGHRVVYAAVRYLAEAGDPLDEVAVLARLRIAESGDWRTSQAGVILADLAAHASPSWEWHAHQIAKASVRRRALAAVSRAAQLLNADGEFDPDDTAEQIRVWLEEAFTAPSMGSQIVTAADLYHPTVDRIQAGRPPGVVRFPWLDLRHLVPWLRPGQLITVAARPSLGKSVLGQDIARYVSMDQGIPGILFTMEQDRDEVMDRLLSAESGVLLDRITRGELDDDEWKRIASVQDHFTDKLVIDDTPGITLAHIRARMRGMARHQAAQYAIVDYLQLMDGAAGENRQREVSSLVAGLKAIAREFRIPVIMLCQLNRGPESRHDKRPYMSDARESGAVENDSDVAILIHRPDFYESECPRAGEADLIVDKNRNGPRATITVGFQGHYARFVDLAPAEWTPPPSNWTPSSALEGGSNGRTRGHLRPVS